MNQKERKAVALFTKHSEGRLHLERIENSVGEGMADIIGINNKGSVFWIEAKALDAWPARETTLPLRTAFEKGQLAWLRQWMSWNGNSYVLLRIGEGAASEFLLLPPGLALHEFNQKQLRGVALAPKGLPGLYGIIDYLEQE